MPFLPPCQHSISTSLLPCPTMYLNNNMNYFVLLVLFNFQHFNLKESVLVKSAVIGSHCHQKPPIQILRFQSISEISNLKSQTFKPNSTKKKEKKRTSSRRNPSILLSEFHLLGFKLITHHSYISYIHKQKSPKITYPIIRRRAPKFTNTKTNKSTHFYELIKLPHLGSWARVSSPDTPPAWAPRSSSPSLPAGNAARTSPHSHSNSGA